MAILIDNPRMHLFGGRKIRASHLISNIPGLTGRSELMDFAQRIGMKSHWIQDRGTPREHFDVMDGRVNVAVAAGARQVTGRDLIMAIRKKADAVRIHHGVNHE